VLQTLNVLLTPLIPTSVKALSRTLSASKQDSTLSTILQAEKEQILRFSTQRGYLKRRGSYFRSWTEYYAVLSGWYIYCYLSEKDLEFDHYIGIKEATV
jgi:vacuolar protein sorting-associated protein 13A/C